MAVASPLAPRQQPRPRVFLDTRALIERLALVGVTQTKFAHRAGVNGAVMTRLQARGWVSTSTAGRILAGLRELGCDTEGIVLGVNLDRKAPDGTR